MDEVGASLEKGLDDGLEEGPAAGHFPQVDFPLNLLGPDAPAVVLPEEDEKVGQETVQTGLRVFLLEQLPDPGLATMSASQQLPVGRLW